MTTLPHLRLYRLGTGWALILAPLLFLVDNLMHPKELTRGNELEQVGLIADSYDRWQAAHAIGFVAILAFAPAVLGLAFLVRRRQPTLGLVAGASPSPACSASPRRSRSTALPGASPASCRRTRRSARTAPRRR